MNHLFYKEGMAPQHYHEKDGCSQQTHVKNSSTSTFVAVCYFGPQNVDCYKQDGLNSEELYHYLMNDIGDFKDRKQHTGGGL
jgi:hypothetical protein